MALRVFISYAHEDEALLAELAAQLKILERNGLIEHWHDREIMPGQEWDDRIRSELNSADIILLLVSRDFINSDYCWGVEIKHAIERHQSKTACVIPILLRDCLWQDTPFASIQGLPKDMRPVVDWPSRDAAFADVARGIKRAVAELEKRNSTSPLLTSTNLSTSAVENAAPTPARTSHRHHVKREFTDLDKDTFASEAYAAIKSYFAKSLTELTAEDHSINGRFKEIDAHRFTTVAYRNGKKTAACTVSLAGRYGSISIMYSGQENAPPNSYNEALHIEAGDTSLYLRPLMGFQRSSTSDLDQMSAEQAAAYLWDRFLGDFR